jgi:hypothetical protein
MRKVGDLVIEDAMNLFEFYDIYVDIKDGISSIVLCLTMNSKKV